MVRPMRLPPGNPLRGYANINYDVLTTVIEAAPGLLSTTG